MGKIKRIADIVELQLSSAGRMATDPLGSGGFIQDPNRLEKFDADMRTLKSVIASANDKIHLIGESVKSFNDSLTELGKSFIVSKDTAQHAFNAITEGNKRLQETDSSGYSIDLLSGSASGGLYEATMNIKGSRAKEILKEKVAEAGGRVSFSHDKATVQFPITDALYQQYLQEQQAYVKGVSNPLARYSPETRVKHELFDEAMRESGREGRLIRRQEKEKIKARLLAEQEREAKALEAYNAGRLDTETYAGERLKDKLGGDQALLGLSQKEINQKIKAYDKEETKKREEEKDRKRIEAELKKEEKEKSESVRSLRNTAIAIVGIVTVIANIGRRLLTAVLDLGRERREAGLEARALGLPASTLIEAGYVEQARGLKKGTIAGALSALQQKFGDPRALDESALRELAPYIPQAIAPAVRSGLYGGANSQQLLELIVNNAVDRIGKGLNWAGEQVGEKEARRNILSSLERVSPDLAKIANNLYDTNRFGIYAGQAGTYAQWSSVGFGKQNPVKLANAENITQLYEMVGGRFSSEWDMFKSSVLDKLSGILSWLENSNIGLTKEEIATKKMEAYSQALKTEQDIKTEGRNRLSVFGSMLSGYGVDFSKGDYNINGKSIKSLSDLITLSPRNLKELVTKYSDLGTAFQNTDILQQYVGIMLLNRQALDLGKELDKVRKDGNLSGFSFDRIKYSAEHRALVAGDMTGISAGKEIWGVTSNMGNTIVGFNPYKELPGIFAPLAGAGVSYSEAVDYMNNLAGEYGVDLGYGSVSPTASIDALEYAYEEELKLGRGRGTDKIESIMRQLYGGNLPRKANYKTLFNALRTRIKNGALTNEQVNALVTSQYTSADRWNYLQGELANRVPQNIIDMGANAVSQYKSEQAQQANLMWSAVFSDPVVASYISGIRQNNGKITKGTATALDEYTLDVNLNVTSDGKTETKTFRIKSNSSGTKAGATATFDIANAKAQGSSY